MKNLITLNLLLLSAFSASAQISFNEISVMPGTTASYPRLMTDVNGTIYFQATTTAEGTELWTTDGTSAGTKLVKDLVPGQGESNPSSFTAHNGKVYFLTTPPTPASSALWETDGTTAGTTLIKQDFNTYSYAETNLISILNSKMIFAAGDNATGMELWVSDGTTAGTTILKDIVPGNAGSSPGKFVPFNGKLYFTASNTLPSQELWCTDGTTAGTVMVINTNVAQNAFIRDLCVINNSLYFTATNASGRALYKSDGTTAGTVLVTTFNTNKLSPSMLTRYTVFDNKLFFMTESISSPGHDLWATDGTAAGTIMLRAVSSTANMTDIFIPYNNKLHFCAYDNTTAVLYSTDGTVSGTHPADGFDAATYRLSAISGFAVYNGSLFFSGYSTIFGTNHLYAFNTTTGLSNIRPAANDVRLVVPASLYYDNKLVYNNKLYISAGFNNNQDYELWSIEGTPTAISNTTVKAPQAFTLYPNPANNVLYITGNSYKQASITITNAMGQVVLSETISNNTVSLQGIAPGLYNATIDADGIRETQKLTIQ